MSKRLEESRWFLATYPTLRYKETWVSPKIRVLPSGTFPNSGLKKFRHGKSIALSTKLVVVVAVYYNSINCNSVTPLLRFAVYLLYNLVDKILTDSASRGPSAAAELLVYISVGTTGYSLSNNPRLFKAQQRWAHTTDLLMTMRFLLLSMTLNTSNMSRSIAVWNLSYCRRHPCHLISTVVPLLWKLAEGLFKVTGSHDIYTEKWAYNRPISDMADKTSY